MDRQRVLIIFGAAWLSALLLTWFLWSRTRAPQQEKTISIAAVVHDMQAGSRLQRADLKMVQIAAKDVPKAAVLDSAAAVGRVLMYPVNAGEPLTATKLGALSGAEGFQAMIEPGFRGISVPISDVSGVAGLIQPRSHVDVLFTRTGSMADALTTTILEDVVVLSIGRTTEVQTSTPGTGSQTTAVGSSSQIRAVTLAVTPEDARKLELAKNQGKLSLALRNPLDSSRLGNKDAVTAEAIDPYLFTRTRRPTPVGGGSLAAMTGSSKPKAARKQPPSEETRTKRVVDVFRGEKHLQEVFQ
jgi:pilus assembly protein CpaB